MEKTNVLNKMLEYSGEIVKMATEFGHGMADDAIKKGMISEKDMTDINKKLATIQKLKLQGRITEATALEMKLRVKYSKKPKHGV